MSKDGNNCEEVNARGGNRGEYNLSACKNKRRRKKGVEVSYYSNGKEQKA